MKKLLKEHGLEAANSLAAFVKAQQYHMKDAVERENIDCESEIRRTYDVYIDEEDAKEAEELYRTAITEGHQWARDLDFVGRELVEQVLLTFAHRSMVRTICILMEIGHVDPRCESCNQYASMQSLALQIRHSVAFQISRFRDSDTIHPHTHSLHHFYLPSINNNPTYPSRRLDN
jgi:hypothetical protein